jgi:hypothetical protein
MGTVLSQQTVGEALLATNVAGTTDYTFKQLRQLTQAIAAGAMDAASFKVTQRGAGANMSVDVADGAAWVAGTTDPSYDGQQKYGVPGVSATVNLAGITAPTVSARRDIVVLRAYDNAEDGGAGGGNDARVQYIKNGAETLVAEATPPNSVLLAYVDLTVGVGSVTNAMITDKRPLATSGLPAVAAGMYLAATTALAGTGYVVVPFDTATTLFTSAPGVVDLTTHLLTAPVAGLYRVQYSATGTVSGVVTKNGAPASGTDAKIIITSGSGEVLVQLAAGDTIGVYANNTGGPYSIGGGKTGSVESGFLRMFRIGA